MKSFNNIGGWELFCFMVLLGAFFIGSFVFQDQSHVITKVEAQVASYFDGSLSGYSVFTGGMASQNISFSWQPFSSSQARYLSGAVYPGDVMFESRTHPGDIIFNQALFPGDVILDSPKDGSRGKKLK